MYCTESKILKFYDDVYIVCANLLAHSHNKYCIMYVYVTHHYCINNTHKLMHYKGNMLLLKVANQYSCMSVSLSKVIHYIILLLQNVIILHDTLPPTPLLIS